jgi:hypothetical protein
MVGNDLMTDASGEIRNARAAYFLTAFPLTSWYSQLGEIQSRMAVSNGTWGLLLVVSPFVMFCSTRLYVVAVPRRLAHTALRASVTAMAVDVLCLGLVRSLWELVFCLILLGLFNGVLQTEINVRAHSVEKLSRRAIFTSCHGWYSVGILTAGLVAFGLAWAHWPPLVQFALAAGVGVVGQCVFRLRPLPVLAAAGRESAGANADPDDGTGGAFKLPMAVLVVLAFVLLEIDSSINTWHTTFAESGLRLSGYGGAIYAVYAVGSLIIRFCGDAIRERCGALTMFLVMGPISASCLFAAVLSRQMVVVLAAFFFWGLALGMAYPDVLKLGARAGSREAAGRMAKIVTAGTLGVLLSNPIMGAISQWSSVNTAFGFLATLTLGVSGWTGLLRYRSSRPCRVPKRRISRFGGRPGAMPP